MNAVANAPSRNKVNPTGFMSRLGLKNRHSSWF